MVTDVLEMTGTRLLGFDAAANYLNVNGQTIRRLIARGVLQPVRIPTLRRILFDRQDLDSLIESGKVAQNQADNSMALVAMGIEGHVEG
jgi:excisionase family DNA binding protein